MRRVILVVIGLVIPVQLRALPSLLGDLDEDGIPTIADAVILVNHISGEKPLPEVLERFADVNQDGLLDAEDSDLIVMAATGSIALPEASETPTAFVPETTNKETVTVSGTAPPNFDVTVIGGVTTVSTTADTNGKYSLTMSLQPNRLNRLFASAIGPDGKTSAQFPFEVIQNSRPPSLFIDFPLERAVLANDRIVIAGRVGDLLSGFMGLEVGVINETVETENQPANVIVGIGTNGTFERRDVPLALGENIIVATASDVHGNTVSKRITLTRIPVEGPRMEVVSGDGQTAIVNARLPDHIVVRLTHENGAPFANKLVTFNVTRSNGRLTGDPDSDVPGKMMLQRLTDANGEASAFWTLGSDAGCGNNRVSATSRDITGTTFFCASADPGPARQINIGAGNNQRAEANARAPEPLRVWVNDSCNGAQGVAVTFTIARITTTQ